MKTIEIKEEFKIPGTNVVLEKGDSFVVFKEAPMPPAVKNLIGLILSSSNPKQLGSDVQDWIKRYSAGSAGNTKLSDFLNGIAS